MTIYEFGGFMKISSVSRNNYNYNYKKQSFGMKDPRLEREKYMLSDYIHKNLHPSSDSEQDNVVRAIVKLKGILRCQVKYPDSTQTKKETLELGADLAFLDSQGFQDGSITGLPPCYIKEAAKKLGLEDPSIDGIGYTLGIMLEMFYKGMTDPRSLTLVANGSLSHYKLKSYRETKAKLLPEINELTEQKKDKKLLENKITQLKKMLVENINVLGKYDHYYSDRDLTLPLAIELAWFNRVYNYQYDGLDDLIEPYKSFVDVFANRQGILWYDFPGEHLFDPKYYKD